MPLYEYQCRECGSSLEARQKFSDAPLTDCPTCETEGSLFRVIQAPGVVFKGSGFYVTDHRSNNPASPAKNGKNGSDHSSSEKSTAAESKPAAAETPA